MLNIQRLAQMLSWMTLLMALVACTPSEPKSSRLSIDIPMKLQSINKQSSTLARLIVNVTGAGIAQPILKIWDENNSATAISGSVTIDVPTGKERLVQALAVYRDDTNGAIKFYYGDQGADFSKLEESVKIAMSDLNASSNIAEGGIAGRYISSTVSGVDLGPTSDVSIVYQPPNGRPVMLIEKSSIANGWFQFFALKGISFRYLLTDGSDLFGGEVDLDNAAFAASSRVARISIPQSSSVDQSVYTNEDTPIVQVVGYFGTGTLTSKRICHNLAGATQSRYLVRNATAASHPAMGIQVLADNAVVNLRPTTASTNLYVQGGALFSDSPSGCATFWGSANTSLYRNFLPITAANFNHGKDGLAGFRFPFGNIEPPAGAPPADGSFNFAVANSFPVVAGIDATAMVGGRFLPGIGSMITGVDAYRIPAAAGQNFDDDGFPCQVATSGAFGISPAGSGVVGSAGGYLLTTTLTPPEILGGAHVGVCFRTAQGLRERGVFVRNSLFNQNNSGGPYLRLENDDFNWTRSEGDHLVLTVGQCSALRLKAYENSGARTVGASTSLNGLGTSGVSFYSNGTCTTSISSITISAGQSQSAVVYAMIATPRATAALTGTSVSGDPLAFEANHNQFGAEYPRLRMLAPASVLSNVCAPFRVEAVTASGAFWTGANLPLTLKLDTSGLTTYTTTDCTTTDPSPGISSSQSTYEGYFKVASSGSLNAAATGFTPGARSVALVTGDALASKIKVEHLQPPQLGKCTEIRISTVNTNGAEVIQTSPVEFDIAVTAKMGAVFGDPQCSMAVDKMIIPAQKSAVSAYVFTNTTGSLAINIEGVELSREIPTNTVVAGPNYISYTAPNLSSPIIGQHEFGAVRTVTLNFPVGATIECQVDSGSGNNPCPVGTVVGNQFNWSNTAAIGAYKYYFGSQFNGQPYFSTKFDPKAIYGGEFRVIQCDTTLSGAVSSADLSTAFTLYSNVCLDSSAAVTCSSSVTLGGGIRNLIGWSSRNSFVVQNASSGLTCLNLNVADSQPKIVANLNFSFDRSTCSDFSPATAIRVTGGSGGATASARMLSNRFQFSAQSCPNQGVKVDGNTSGTISAKVGLSEFQFQRPSGADAMGVVLDGTHAGDLRVDRSSFATSGTGGSGVFATVFQSSTSQTAPPMVVSGNSFTGDTQAVATMGTDFSGRSLAFTGNLADVGIGSSFFVDLWPGNLAPHRVSGNQIKFQSPSIGSALRVRSDSSYATTADIHLNKFIQVSAGTSIYTSPGGQTLTLNLKMNSMLSLSTALSSLKGIDTNSAPITVNVPNGGDGGNRICRVDGTFGYDDFFSDSGNVSGTFTAPAFSVIPGATTTCF